MRIRRRSLRKGLVVVGCLVAVFAGPESRPTSCPGRLAAAFGLLAIGSALHLWAKGCLEQNRRLTTAGPYRFTRNPFYLANLLVDLGLCAVIGRVWLAVPYVVLWWVAYRETIRREEERLAALFPEEFERYALAVPRLIPNGRSLPRAESRGRFALANPSLAEGREYARILGIWISAASILAAGWVGKRGPSAFEPEHTRELALVLLLPVAWVVKLAIAEVFRRSGTDLLPHADDAICRRWASGIAAVVAVGSLLSGDRAAWLAPWPLLWLALAAVDHFSRLRRPRDERGAGLVRRAWPARGRVAAAAGALLVVVGLARSGF